MECNCSEKELTQMTLGKHAEQWWREQGEEVPEQNSQAWKAMYEKWVEFAFSKSD